MDDTTESSLLIKIYVSSSVSDLELETKLKYKIPHPTNAVTKNKAESTTKMESNVIFVFLRSARTNSYVFDEIWYMHNCSISRKLTTCHLLTFC